MNLLGIAGSLREGSHSKTILTTLQEQSWEDASIKIYDLECIPLYNADFDGDMKPDDVASFKTSIQDADGLIIVSPEYNYGMSGVLKNALDWASRPAYKSVLKDKPAIVITSSPASTGGVRAHEQVRKLLHACLAQVVPCIEVAIPKVHEKITDERLTDETSLKMAVDSVNALIDWCRKRERVPVT